jgi:hypothetical protein
MKSETIYEDMDAPEHSCMHHFCSPPSGAKRPVFEDVKNICLTFFFDGAICYTDTLWAGKQVAATKKADLLAKKKADLLAKKKADLLAKKKADLLAKKKADLLAKKICIFYWLQVTHVLNLHSIK